MASTDERLKCPRRHASRCAGPGDGAHHKPKRHRPKRASGTRYGDGRGRCAERPYWAVVNQIVVRPGAPLEGTVRVSGAKNSALKLMAATLLAEGDSRL